MTTTFKDEEEGKEDDDGFSETTTRRSSSSVPKAKVNNTRETLFLLRWTLCGIVWKSHLSNPGDGKNVFLFVVDSKRSLFFVSLITRRRRRKIIAFRFVSFLFSFACGDERPRRLTKDFPRFLSLSLSNEWMNECIWSHHHHHWKCEHKHDNTTTTKHSSSKTWKSTWPKKTDNLTPRWESYKRNTRRWKT